MVSNGIGADGGSIRERRLAVGLTQQELAHRARCSITTVRFIEYGGRPSRRMVERLDKALTRASAALKEVNH